MKKNTKKTEIFGAGEKGQNLDQITNYSQPLENYPITFGKGAWDEDTLATIAQRDDNKIRFVWNIDSTNSGAIYTGNMLASSKILDITPNENDGNSEIKVKFITSNYDISTFSFKVVDPSLLDNLITNIEDKIQELDDWAKGDIITSDSSNSGVTVTPDNQVHPTYNISINTDNSENPDIDVVDNQLKVSSYTLVKEDQVSDEFAAQYKLMVTKPGSDVPVLVGETINIFKDYVLKGAHVCTFNKNADGTPYVIEETIPIDSIEVYAQIYDPSIADVSVISSETGEVIYLEKAPTGKGLYVNHTYLHLIVNVKPDDDHEPVSDDTENINNTTTDVYLDFTEIINSGEFLDLRQDISILSNRVKTIEDNYIKSIDIADSSLNEQFKTITINNVIDGVDTSTSFDIADNSYYNQIFQNFEIINENNQTFENSLSWKGLD